MEEILNNIRIFEINWKYIISNVVEIYGLFMDLKVL